MKERTLTESMRKNKLLLVGILVLVMALIVGIITYHTVNSSKQDDSEQNDVTPNISIVDNSIKQNITNNSEQNEIGTSEYYGQLYMDNKPVRLYSNLWGITDKEKNDKTLESYIYYKSDGSFGWEWNRPDPRPNKNTYIAPIYLEAIVGAITGESYYSDYFPIEYGDINNWIADVEYRTIKSPNGRNNLAFDLYWLDPDDLYNKKFNIMIWLQGHHDEQSIGIVSDGINEYIHYKRDAGAGQYWEVHVFELKNQNLSHNKVDIKKLLDNAFPSGILHDEWIISGMELGSEVWRGSGRIEIEKYIVNLNDHIIQ